MTSHLLMLAQAQGLPDINSTYWILLVSRILHIVGAIILVGGLFYIRTIISPVEAPPGSAPADTLFGGRRANWAKWVGIATALLLVTGLWNYWQIIQQNERLASKYHMIAGIKMIAGVAVFLLAALLAGRTALAEALRRNWRTWLNVCLALAIVTIALGSVLRTFPRVLKAEASDPPKLIAPANSPSAQTGTNY